MITRATIGHAIPTILTFAVLIAVGWWGHHTGWTLARPHVTHDPHAEDWCAEHGVHESECLLCKKSLMKEMKAKEPAAHLYQTIINGDARADSACPGTTGRRSTARARWQPKLRLHVSTKKCGR